MCICIYTHICIYVYVYTLIYACICVYICICIYTYICIYMYIHIYMYIYVYMYMYMEGSTEGSISVGENTTFKLALINDISYNLRMRTAENVIKEG